MRKTILGTIVVVLAFGLSGCGEKSAEDVAETFVIDISKSALTDAKKISTERVQKKIDKLPDLCRHSQFKTLEGLSAVAVTHLFKHISSGAYDDALEKMLDTFEVDLDKKKEEIKVSLNKKYGNVEKLTQEKRVAMETEMIDLVTKLYAPLIEDEFKLFEFKTKNEKDVKKVIALIMMGGKLQFGDYRLGLRGTELRTLVSKVLASKSLDVTSECIDKYTEFGKVDEVNTIEVKVVSPDKKVVRLEILKENGKSKKVSIEIEKIQNKWMVSEMELDMPYW